jgi:hypothetical protein
MNNIKIYNTSVEVGVRLLMIIKRFNKGIDLESMIVLDYLILHANIVDKNFSSLHPDNPFHGLELISKRSVTKDAINLLIAKGLIDIEFSQKGIIYLPNAITDYFLSFFEGAYFNNLSANIDKIVNKFAKYDEKELQKYVADNLENWRGKKINTIP